LHQALHIRNRPGDFVITRAILLHVEEIMVHPLYYYIKYRRIARFGRAPGGAADADLD